MLVALGPWPNAFWRGAWAFAPWAHRWARGSASAAFVLRSVGLGCRDATLRLRLAACVLSA
eukprot:37103-Pyramimonas_sp.AAC.1